MVCSEMCQRRRHSAAQSPQHLLWGHLAWQGNTHLISSMCWLAEQATCLSRPPTRQPQVECTQSSTNDIVKAVFKLRDKAGTELSRTTLLYVRQPGTFFNQGPSALVPKLRFARFMAYAPPDVMFDNNDGCGMMGARFKNLRLYDQTAKAWQAWEWSKIE